MILTKKLKLLDPKGLNPKACFQLRQLASRFKCRITVRVEEKTYSLKSLWAVLFLMMAEGEEMEIVAHGKDAEIAMVKIRNFHVFGSEVGKI